VVIATQLTQEGVNKEAQREGEAALTTPFREPQAYIACT